MSDELVPRVLEGEIIDREIAGSVRVLTLRSPFLFAREERFVSEGRTLADILADLDLPDWQSAMVAIDGRPVKAEWWATTRPKPGHLVTIRCIPRGPGGGGGGDKGWVQVAAGVVLIVLGVVIGLYTGVGWAVGIPLITLGVGLVIGGGLALIFPPPSLPRLKAGSGNDAPVFSITGSRNQANPYGAIPVVYGRHRLYPPTEGT